MAKTKQVEEIYTWSPSDDERICYKDGKLCIFEFDKVFRLPEYEKYREDFDEITSDWQRSLGNYNVFHVKRQLYEKQLDVICHTINYFVAKFDTNKELPMAYLVIQYMLEKLKRFGPDDIDAYVDFIYDVLFTPTIIKAIEAMVEKNYLDDIESGDKNYSSGKKHLHSLEFTNRHVKILLATSTSIKLMTPVVMHYLAYNAMSIQKTSDTLYKFYKRLFTIFGDPAIFTEKPKYDENGELIKPVPVDMYNKLFVYVSNKVQHSASSNHKMYEQREVYGVDIYSVIHLFLINILISDNMIKIKFGQNIIGFIKAIVNIQSGYFIREQYKNTLIEVSNIKNSENLSGTEKLIMNMNKLDETLMIITDENINATIKSLIKENGDEITKEEVEWTMSHHRPNSTETSLVRLFFSQRFDSYTDLKALNLYQYTYLLLILRNQLLRFYSYGITVDGDEAPRTAILPTLLMANSEGSNSNRLIKSQRFDTLIKESSTYQNMINGEYRYIMQIGKGNDLLNLVKAYTKMNMVYCDYYNQERNGEIIDFDENQLADEVLFFMRTL